MLGYQTPDGIYKNININILCGIAGCCKWAKCLFQQSGVYNHKEDMSLNVFILNCCTSNVLNLFYFMLDYTCFTGILFCCFFN